jgi:Fe(3+) dicitrate transport protein
MFATDPTQATRTRNYFSPTINVPSFRATYRLSANTTVEFTSSAVIGTRNSVMFDKLATIQDTLNRATLQYANRQVDIDRFNSFTNELRVLSHYKIGQMESNLASGVQVMTNDLHRTQLGKGTTGDDYDLTLVDPVWGRDLHFATNNIAIYAENSFYVLKNLKVNAGARVEMGESSMSGKISYYPENRIPVSIKHQYPLLGASFSYKPSSR